MKNPNQVLLRCIKSTFSKSIKIGKNKGSLAFIMLSITIQSSFTQVILYEEASCAKHIDSLRKHFGVRKEIPKEYELATLVALSHYPDLKNTRIKFVLKENVKLPIATRPAELSFLRLRKGRLYRVIINPNSKGFVLNKSFNQQVGIIGHELAHIQHYVHTSFIGVAWQGLRYITSQNYWWRYETDTDRRTVKYGLGWQLYDFQLYLKREDMYEELKKYGHVPDSLDALVQESRIDMIAGRNDEVIRKYRRINKIVPFLQEVSEYHLTIIGNGFLDAEDYENAEKFFRLNLAFNPGSESGTMNLRRCLRLKNGE